MADPERETVLQRDQARKQLRQTLLSDVEQAKHELHPRTLSARWTAKQKARLADVGASMRQNIAKNAPLIGFAAAAGLLFATRKPISKWIDLFRNRKRHEEGDE